MKKSLFEEDNVYKVIYISIVFMVQYTAYSSFQAYLVLVMKQIAPEKSYIASIGLGTLYMSFCISEFLISPYFFSLYSAKKRKILFFMTSLTFGNIMVAYANIVTCISNLQQGNEKLAFICEDWFIYLYVVISSVLCGMGGSIMWLTQGIYIVKCCRPWTRGRYSGLFYLIFNFNNIIANLLGYFVLGEDYILLFFIINIILTVISSIMFLFTPFPTPKLMALVNNMEKTNQLSQLNQSLLGQSHLINVVSDRESQVRIKQNINVGKDEQNSLQIENSEQIQRKLQQLTEKYKKKKKKPEQNLEYSRFSQDMHNVANRSNRQSQISATSAVRSSYQLVSMMYNQTKSHIQKKMFHSNSFIIISHIVEIGNVDRTKRRKLVKNEDFLAGQDIFQISDENKYLGKVFSEENGLFKSTISNKFIHPDKHKYLAESQRQSVLASYMIEQESSLQQEDMLYTFQISGRQSREVSGGNLKNQIINTQISPLLQTEELNILTYRDFFDFLRYNKLIRNLIPSYMFTGLYYGFWQKMGNVVLQVFRKQDITYTYNDIYMDVSIIFIIASAVQFSLSPVIGYLFDIAGKDQKKDMMAIIMILSMISVAVFPLPFILELNKDQDVDQSGNLIMLYGLAVLYAIGQSGLQITSGPIRSFTFSNEKELILSFAAFRFIYFFSISIAFFASIGIPANIQPFFMSGVLIILCIWSWFGVVVKHQYS